MFTTFMENTYFEKLKEFNHCIKRAVRAQAFIELLNERGVPEGSVIFNSPKKRYTNKSGKEREYQYTQAYLYIKGVKYHVSKKHNYPKFSLGRNTNDPSNPDNRLILQERLMMRMQAKSEYKHNIASAKLLANFLNSTKLREIPRIVFAQNINEAENDFWNSEEGRNLPSLIDHFLDGHEFPACSFGDLRPTVEEKYMNLFSQQAEELLAENSESETYLPDLCVSNVVSRKNQRKTRNWYKVKEKTKGQMRKNSSHVDRRVNLRNKFENEILNSSGERFRSKNEEIVVRCAKDCGLSYTLEPCYANSYLRADMMIHTAKQDVWVEIAGLRSDPEYEKHLQEKIKLAKTMGICLVVIDMTAYKDSNGKEQMRVNYVTVCRIFQYIQLGMLREGIVMPY